MTDPTGTTLSEYQNAVMRTFAAQGNRQHELAILGLGLAGETGEFVDMLKKVLGHGHEFDLPKLKEEAGDILWYLAALLDLLGISLEQAAVENIAKLRARYPDGFSEEASRNRIA
jgi:NTP pyrophosphatase (non-canonical NTP hydrolase)